MYGFLRNYFSWHIRVNRVYAIDWKMTFLLKDLIRRLRYWLEQFDSYPEANSKPCEQRSPNYEAAKRKLTPTKNLFRTSFKRLSKQVSGNRTNALIWHAHVLAVIAAQVKTTLKELRILWSWFNNRFYLITILNSIDQACNALRVRFWELINCNHLVSLKWT